METEKESGTFFKRLSYSLLSITLLGFILYVGQGILIPIFFAMLLAALLLPAVSYLRRKKLSRALSIIIPLVLSILIILGVIYFLSTQIAHFFDDLPALKQRLNELTTSVQKWVAENFNIALRKQEQYLDETAEKVKTVGPKLVGQTFLSVTEMLSYLVLVPIYTFLILYYKETIKKFFIDSFKETSKNKVEDILHESGAVSQRYIGGLLIETVIVFTLNSIGFLILGIKYAIFLALLAALLNLVPYIGIIVANILSILITLISSDNPSDALWVGIVLALVQIYDNNIGMPLIVGNNVRINALATIVGVLIGNALCGVPGMFLAIPGLATLKIIFDRVRELKPWGVLLGDDSTGKKEEKKTIVDSIKSKIKKAHT